MTILKQLNFFQRPGLYVIEDIKDTDDWIFLKEELPVFKYANHWEIVSRDNATYRIKQGTHVKTILHDEAINVLGLADIPERMQSMFVDGTKVEVYEGRQYPIKHQEYLDVNDVVLFEDKTVKTSPLYGMYHAEIVSITPSKKEEDEKNDRFDIRILSWIYWENGKPKFNPNDIVRNIKRTDLKSINFVEVTLRCPCCNHQI